MRWRTASSSSGVQSSKRLWRRVSMVEAIRPTCSSSGCSSPLSSPSAISSMDSVSGDTWALSRRNSAS